jgi:hypothetical protein
MSVPLSIYELLTNTTLVHILSNDHNIPVEATDISSNVYYGIFVDDDVQE